MVISTSGEQEWLASAFVYPAIKIVEFPDDSAHSNNMKTSREKASDYRWIFKWCFEK